MAQPRESVYFLSAVANFLQAREKEWEETPLNPDGVQMGDGSIEVRMLNHLSTSLSRGTKKEATKVVAPVGSSIYDGDVAVSVISRFGKEKVSLSPQGCLSNSLSVVDPTVSEAETVNGLVSKPQESASEGVLGPLSVFQPSVSLTPDTLPLTSNYSVHAAATHSAGEAATQQNGPAEEQHHILITRNSEFRNPTGTTDEIVIPPVHLDPSGLNHLLSLVTHYSSNRTALPQPTPSTFAEFVHSSLSLLRAAAVRIKAEPEKAAEIQAAVFCHFMSSCLANLKSRLGRFVSTYGDLKILRNWTPTSTESVDDSTFVIKDETTRTVLGGIGLVPHANRTYMMNTTNIPLWWSGIGQIIGLLCRAVQQGNIPSAAGYSAALSNLILRLPSAFWALQSLKQHLGSRRLSLKTTAGNDEADADADTDVDMEDEFNSPTTTHETRLFCRAVESLCAWTTGPNALLGSPIARSTLDITISIRDLPRVPLEKVAIKDLVNRWADAGKWDSDLRAKAISSLREKYGIQEDEEDDKQEMGSSEGECHCEAGLMALYTESQDEGFPTSAIENLPDGINCRSHIPIGVTKKCCPLCRMLADILNEKQSSKFELPGKHTRFYAWVPPELLPLSVVEELEGRMLKVVEAMLQHGKHLKGSRASSPGSDKGTTYYGNTFVTRSVEEDVQSYNR